MMTFAFYSYVAYGYLWLLLFFGERGDSNRM